MIVPMKRLTLVAHKSDESDILKALQRLGAVEVIPGEEASATSVLDVAEERVQRLSGALAVLRPYAAKKGMLTPRPETTVGAILQDLPEALSCGDEVESLQREMQRIKAEMDKNNGLIEMLQAWQNFPADMQAFRNAKSVRYFLGLLASADLDRLAELGDAAEYQVFDDGAILPVLVACAPDDAKTVAGFLKSLAWTDVAFPKLSGTPAQAAARLRADNETLEQQRAELETQLAAKGANSPLLEGALDAAVIERDRALAAAELSRTAATFELHGWVPENRLSDVERAVAGVTDAYCLFTRDPNDDETPPSVVKNNRFVTPFEVVTDLYSRPDPRGMDPTPFMAIPYIVLFGLMLSDSGYGLLLAIGCALFIRLRRPTGMMGGLARVLLWGGLSTIIWGVLVGTVFGLDFDVLLGTDDLFPIILDPMTDPIGMLILCFGLGVVHIPLRVRPAREGIVCAGRLAGRRVRHALLDVHHRGPDRRRRRSDGRPRLPAIPRPHPRGHRRAADPAVQGPRQAQPHQADDLRPWRAVQHLRRAVGYPVVRAPVRAGHRHGRHRVRVQRHLLHAHGLSEHHPEDPWHFDRLCAARGAASVQHCHQHAGRVCPLREAPVRGVLRQIL